MTLQELRKQALQLSAADRWQLVQILLESLRPRGNPQLKRGNLSRLRGIARVSKTIEEGNSQDDYTTYLTQKYQ